MVITLSLRRDVAAMLICAKLITKGGQRAFLSSTSSHISQNPKACKNLTLGDEPSQGFRTPRWLVDTSTTRGPKFYMQSPFRALGNPLERFSWEVYIQVDAGHACNYHPGGYIAKRDRLGPRNDPESLGPKNYEKTSKLENNCFEPGG